MQTSRDTLLATRTAIHPLPVQKRQNRGPRPACVFVWVCTLKHTENPVSHNLVSVIVAEQWAAEQKKRFTTRNHRPTPEEATVVNHIQYRCVQTFKFWACIITVSCQWLVTGVVTCRVIVAWKVHKYIYQWTIVQPFLNPVIHALLYSFCWRWLWLAILLVNFNVFLSKQGWKRTSLGYKESHSKTVFFFWENENKSVKSPWNHRNFSSCSKPVWSIGLEGWHPPARWRWRGQSQ